MMTTAVPRRARTFVTAILLALAAVVGLVGSAEANPATGAIHGAVTLPDGVTWSDVDVYAKAVSSDSTTYGPVQVTSGSFTLDGLPAGSYVLVLTDNNRRVGNKAVQAAPVTEGGTNDETVTLGLTSSATGHIDFPTGYPTGSVQVVALEQVGDGVIAVATVGNDGSYTLTGLSTGYYTLVAVTDDRSLPDIYLSNTYVRDLSDRLHVASDGSSVPVPTIDWRTKVFTDVPSTSAFAFPIAWLVSEQVVVGWVDGSFRPLNPVNRDAVAVWLYRLAGSPAFTPPATSPFKDVSTSNEYYKQITWLAAEGISTGWPDGTFRPLQPVRRDAMAAFLYRYKGSPAFTPPVTSPFKDVPTASKFYAEVSWLATKGISTGWSDGTYRPLKAVARDAMAAFLFRTEVLHRCDLSAKLDPTRQPLC